uniref:Uncharacterized protein n=1 Tax=Mycena chlorophos TaxID=658473 RepID=A0ABQ0M4V1_MYCCL|nr:predicted protein [Mycena chlorophos]
MSTDSDDEMDLDPQTPRAASPAGHRDQATTPDFQIITHPGGVYGSSIRPSLAEVDEFIASTKSYVSSRMAAQTGGSQSISRADGSSHDIFGLPHFLAHEHGHFPDYLSHQPASGHQNTVRPASQPPHAHAASADYSHTTQADIQSAFANSDRVNGVRSFGSEPALGALCSSQSVFGDATVPQPLGHSSNFHDTLHHPQAPALNIPAASSSSNTGFLFPFEEQRPLPNSGFPPPSLMAQLDLVRIEPAASANRVPDLVLDGTAWDRNMPSLRISSTSSPMPIASGSGSGSSQPTSHYHHHHDGPLHHHHHHYPPAPAAAGPSVASSSGSSSSSHWHADLPPLEPVPELDLQLQDYLNHAFPSESETAHAHVHHDGQPEQEVIVESIYAQMDGIKKEYEAKLAKSVAEVVALEELLTSLLLRITAPKAGDSEASAGSEAEGDAGAGAASGSSGSSSGLGADPESSDVDVGSAKDAEDADAATAALWASVEQINGLIAMEVDQQQSFQTLIRFADFNRPPAGLGPRPGLDLDANLNMNEAVVDIKGKGKAKAVDLNYLQWG